MVVIQASRPDSKHGFSLEGFLALLWQPQPSEKVIMDEHEFLSRTDQYLQELNRKYQEIGAFTEQAQAWVIKSRACNERAKNFLRTAIEQLRKANQTDSISQSLPKQ